MAVVCLMVGMAAAQSPIADVVWRYSVDGGRTFVEKPAATHGPLVARATFTVADPSAVAGIEVTLPGEGGAFTRGRESEWKCPVLIETSVELNGRPAGHLPSPWIVYDRVALDPTTLVKGENTLLVRGEFTHPGFTSHDCAHRTDPVAMALTAFGPEELQLQSGPVVGAFGEDFFTVCVRTNGAGATVTLTARTDTGAEIALTSEPGLFHRFRAPVPRGTRSVTYRLATAVGGRAAPAAAGPFTIALPDFANGKLRFAVVGDTDGRGWAEVAAKIHERNVDLLVHAGGMNYFPFLNDRWTGIFQNAAALHATLPTYAVRGFRDNGSFEFANLFHRPTPDGKGENWTQVLGSVRLIGLGLDDWAEGSASLAWLEETLAAAREKFVFVVFHPAAYSSDESCRPPLSGLLQFSRGVIAPLLARHKVTAMISGNSHGYERSEPTPDKGVTQLVAGACGGTTRPRPSGRADGNNGFLAAYKGVTHYMVFEAEGDACVLKVFNLAGDELDGVTFNARK